MKSTTFRKLVNWERENGRRWVDEIRMMAERGHTVREVAEHLGVSHQALKSMLLYRQIKVAWQGNSSPIVKEQQRRSASDQHARRYDYRGQQRTLRQLSELSGLPVSTIKSRIHKYGMSVEKALSLPFVSRQERGHRGGTETIRRYGRVLNQDWRRKLEKEREHLCTEGSTIRPTGNVRADSTGRRGDSLAEQQQPVATGGLPADGRNSGIGSACGSPEDRVHRQEVGRHGVRAIHRAEDTRTPPVDLSVGKVRP